MVLFGGRLRSIHFGELMSCSMFKGRVISLRGAEALWNMTTEASARSYLLRHLWFFCWFCMV